MAFNNLELRHLPGLLIASSETFGGFWPLFNAERAILAFGLPGPIAQSVPAQTTMFIASSRISTIGMIIFALYGQGNLAAVDTVLAVMGLYVGVMDGYFCWREGRPKMGLFRSAGAFTVAAVGLAGCTAGGQG
ncbi:hypothetical protein INS49_007933 [Diaporthe citri]|uniref:uncharacterized protein n=1 Tax=Diaporthe citri TaxID=83186 RepID=UPI001C7F8D4F|nr:uncharacterized protein INS49_007933 [Diaporthe citri]KAG6362839.1 hypothetical protein INS49_007933 [Diaporthe citri]